MKKFQRLNRGLAFVLETIFIFFAAKGLVALFGPFVMGSETATMLLAIFVLVPSFDLPKFLRERAS